MDKVIRIYRYAPANASEEEIEHLKEGIELVKTAVENSTNATMIDYGSSIMITAFMFNIEFWVTVGIYIGSYDLIHSPYQLMQLLKGF